MATDQDVLAVLHASAGRRILGIGAMGVLGCVLIYVAMARPPEAFVAQVFLLGTGAMAIWLADAIRRATSVSIELTRSGLHTSGGELIATLDQIDTVDRGIFAFKPSNGFLVRLTQKAPVRWQPGLWWRFGKRLGVGGVTPGGQARAMADILTALKCGDIS